MADRGPGSTPSDVSEEKSYPPLTLEEFPAPSLDEWRAVVEKDLNGADFDKKLVWKTLEGIDVQPMYFRKDLDGLAHLNTLPGFAPYTRGTQPLGSVSYPWQIRQDCMLAAPEDVNGALRDALARGQTAIGIRLDNAARQGYDGDSPEARELAGRGGCTLSSINGLRIALADIDFVKYPVTIRTGTAALPVLAMLIALVDEHGNDRKDLVGAIECDPVRELVKAGSLRGPLELHFREMADMVAFCSRECPGMRPVMVNSNPWHNAGASAVQELAFTMATAVEYMRQLTDRGIDADTAALSLIFNFSVSTNLFMEIAKLRAARTLWAKIARAFGANREESQKMFIHVRTSTYTKTQNDPYNNMLRSTIEAFAGAAGGCDSMFVAPFDECIGRPDEFSMRVARNQQLLLQEEAYLTKVVDPGAGSYYIESLTDSIGRESWKLFQEVEADGGLVKALQAGTPQEKVEATAAKKRDMISKRRLPIVGVSNYANPTEKPMPRRHIPRDAFIAERRKRLSRLKHARKYSTVKEHLDLLTNAVYTGEGNLMEIAIGAAREGATIGETVRALLDGTQGETPTIKPLKSERASMQYEVLRANADAWKERHGDLPSVFLVPTGPLAWRRARMDFCYGFFGAAGFKMIEPKPFDNMDDAAKAAAESGCRLIVICSDDESYPKVVPELIEKMKSLKSGLLTIVAGYPQDCIDELKDAGVDGFVHLRCDAVEVLTDLQKRLGISSEFAHL